MDIKVAVVGRNSEGAPDIIVYQIDCSQEEVDSGAHYDIASDQAKEAGYEPVMAFDENDPAWKSTAWNVFKKSDDEANKILAQRNNQERARPRQDL